MLLKETIDSANTGLDAIKKAPIVNENTGIKCLRIGDVSNKKIYEDWGNTKVSKDNYEKFKLTKGDILIARTGNTIGCNLYIDNEYSSVFNNGLIRLKINNNIADSKFIYYTLQQKKYMNYIDGIAFGTSTQPNMKINDLLQFEIPNFSLKIQKKIVKILSNIDNKIELNNKINNNLEKQAQLIFKSWFVDFEPFKDLEVLNWKKDILGNLVTIRRGSSPRPIQNYLSKNGFNWLKISDVSNLTSPFVFKTQEKIKEEGLKKTVLLSSGDLVVSNSATPGIPKILNTHCCIHDGWLYFTNSIFSNEFLYLFFKYKKNELVTFGNGSVFTNLKTDILKNIEIFIPPKEILNEFNKIIKPIFKMILSSSQEVNKLINLKNYLLPKLMNGEIDVEKIEL